MLTVSSVIPVTTQSVVSEADGSTSAATAEMTAGILSYARWPTARETVRLCLVGTSANMARMANRRMVNGQQLQISRVGVTEVDVAHCDAAYIGRTTLAERTAIVRGIANQPILSMTDNDSQCRSGAMICLRTISTGVTFDLNIDAVSRSRVRIDPRVLALGRRTGAAR